jgi:hypothetical protein
MIAIFSFALPGLLQMKILPGVPLRYIPGYFLLALSGLDHFNGRAFPSLAAMGGGLLQDYQNSIPTRS